MFRLTRFALALPLALGLSLPLAARPPAAQPPPLQHGPARGGGAADRGAVPRGAAAATARAARILASPHQNGGLVFISPTSVAFNATDPASQPAVTGSAPVTINADIFFPRKKTAWTLTATAGGAAFTSGGDTIPVSAITYTSTGVVTAGNGTVTTPATPTPLTAAGSTVASGVEGTGSLFTPQVTCNFVFHDSWNYVPGTYSQTVTFTLATP